MGVVASAFGCGCKERNPEEAAAKKEAADAEEPSCAVHLGPVTIVNDGTIEVKPQMKVGAETSNLQTEVGLSDVRDGIKLAVASEAKVEFHAEGHSVPELHRNIKCETVGFKQALQAAESTLCTA